MAFGLYKYFSFRQKWSLLLEAIEYRISIKIPQEVRTKKIFLRSLVASGIQFRCGNDGIIIDYPVNGIRNTFFLRNNSSDISVFTQIIMKQEYKPVIELFAKLNLRMNRFVDAGANAGFSSLYLSAYFPDAEFISLEPHGGNFAALQNNISQNRSGKKFFLLQKALWNKPTTLSGNTAFRDGKDWSFSVNEESDRGEIEGVTMGLLINEYNFNEIDFLKIDIEGAEAQLFSNTDAVASWINKIKIMSIEIHDETGARFKIENMIQNLGFRIYHSGEITIAVNKEIVPQLLTNEQ